MTRKSSLLAVVLASSIFGGVLANAKPAAAWWSRSYGGNIDTVQSGTRVWASQVDYPVTSSSSMPVSAATQIYVETYNLRSDSSSLAQICAARWNGGGEICSPTQTKDGLGHKTYDFSADEAIWNTDTFFPYVTVIGSAPVVTTAVRVTGIFIAN